MSLEEELYFARQQRNRYAELVRELETRENAERVARLPLPTEPGWYLTNEGQIALLTHGGRWEDGWGNDWESGGELESIEGAARLVPEER